MYEKLGLYVHIPFCKRKCAYCDFNSYDNKEKLVESYIESLCKEIELSSPKGKCIAGSIFIGGGTPSLLDGKHIEQVLKQIRNYYYIEDGCEITIESNPGTLTETNLKAYIKSGINRLSIGLQACQDKHLKTLGRIHDYQMFEESYLLARKTGFKNINIDLIFGVPGLNLKEWKETLEKVINLKPEHLSCYSLKIEAKTLFNKIYNQSEGLENKKYPNLPSEKQEREMYYTAIQYLKQNGYKHYEISNFSLEGYECRHNIVYWKCREYLGFGAGAHSYYKGKRYRNYLNIEKYISSLGRNKLPTTDVKKINSDESIGEYIILGLRLIDGININEFKQRFNLDFEEIYKAQINKLIKGKLLQKMQQNYCLTQRGLDLANQVMLEFI
ncbi:MAG: radical SAM family heme chaperone HemW [Ignavibacteriales bacterium]